MIGLDTNVLIRYLTRDDLDQWERASQVIQGNQPCFISNVVLCEVVWVLIPISSMLATDTFLAPPLARGAGGVEVWHLKRKLVLEDDLINLAKM